MNQLHEPDLDGFAGVQVRQFETLVGFPGHSFLDEPENVCLGNQPPQRGVVIAIAMIANCRRTAPRAIRLDM